MILKLFEKEKVNVKWIFLHISLKFVNKKINYGYLVTRGKR